MTATTSRPGAPLLALLALLSAVVSLPLPARAQDGADDGEVPDYVQVRTFTDKDGYRPGEVARVVLEMRIDKRVHVNANVPTEDYQYPTDLVWDEALPAQPSAIAWPKPAMKGFEFTEGKKIAVLEGTQRASFTVAVPAAAAPGLLTVKGTFQAQGCTHTTCYAPQRDDVAIALRVVAAGEPTQPINDDKFPQQAPAGTAGPSAPPAATASAAGAAPDAAGSSDPHAATAPGDAAATPDGTAAVTTEGATGPTEGAAAEPGAGTEAGGVEPDVAAVGALPSAALGEIVDGEPTKKAFECPIVKDGPSDKPMAWVFLAAFIGGVVLSFTPCVLPLVPITIGFFARQQGTGNRPVLPALAYVLGLALVYSALGTFAALTGNLFGAALQSPFVLVGIALILIGLATSMFGLWNLELPNFLQHRLAGGRSGLLGAGMMGGAMGLIAAPCVGPLVVSLLTYVAELGSRMPPAESAAVGGALFFTLAVGMGLPFFFVALGAAHLPPGEWMVSVKKVFGFVILGLVLWFLRPLIGADMFLWGVVVVLAAAAVFFLVTARAPSHGPKLRVGLVAVGALAAVATVATGVVVARASAGGGHADNHGFAPFDEAALERAVAAGKPVVIDFTAEWCVACEELAKRTFPAPEVQERFRGFTQLQADMTDEASASVQALRKRFSVRGLPTIIFLDAAGNEIRDLRLTGFEKAADFATRLQCASSYEVASQT